MATEIVRVSYNSHLSSEADKRTFVEAIVATVLKQPGAERAYWGTEHENPDKFRLFIDWGSVEDHTRFQNSDTYKSFGEEFGKGVDLGSVEMYHSYLKPHPSAVLSKSTTPATEILVIYFPADYSKADQDKFDADMNQLYAKIKENSDTYTASAGGWIEEDLKIPDSEEKSRAYAGFIGWQSVEAHLKFRETQAFKDNIHLLRGAKDLKKLSVVHYQGTQIDA